MEKPPQDDPPDFELRKYELDRAHELELNKFAHALEVERLKILQLVNGGAFTVLVAFAAPLLSSKGWSAWLALLAGFSWTLGLAAAAYATQRQLDGQGKFNAAYRHRRNAVEWRRLSKIYGGVAASRMIAPLTQDEDGKAGIEGRPSSGADRPSVDEAHPEGRAATLNVKRLAIAGLFLLMLGRLLKKRKKKAELREAPGGESYDARADDEFQEGKAATHNIRKLAGASILLFVAGGLLLAISLALADPAVFAPAARAGR